MRRGPGGGRIVETVTGVAPNITLRLMPTGTSLVAGVPPPSRMLRADAEGRLEGAVPPGVCLARVNPARHDGWLTESVRVDDHDVLDLPLTSRSGEPITDLVISFADRAAEITGVLRHPDGTPEPAVLMIAFAADRRYWTAGSRRVRAVRPAPDGRYEFAGLSPGEYLLAAVNEFDTPGGIAAELLAPLADVATRVSLARGERRELDFQIGGGNR